MRAEIAALLLFLAPCAAIAASDPPDTVAPHLQFLPAVVDTSHAMPDTTALDPARIDVAAARQEGAASLEAVLPLHRAAIRAPLPTWGTDQAALRLPDGGGPVRLDGWIEAGETTTDESWIGSFALGWGAPWLAFALDDPRSSGVEPLDLDSIDLLPPPGAFRAPGEALAPRPRGPATPRAAGDTTRTTVSRTTLLYRRGSGDAELAGARFQTTVFRRGIYASYVRNLANAAAPLSRSLTSRYELLAELVRIGSHRLELEGRIYERTIDDSASGSNEWARGGASLRLWRDGARTRDFLRVGIGRDKKTWVLTRDLNVSPDAGARERWEFPAATAEGSLSYGEGGALTWVASFQAASRKISYRADSTAFDPRRAEARGHLGARRALGRASGVGVDVAYDARETAPGFLDARASWWGTHGRVRGRLDLESAHDRPSWTDLLTPATTHVFVAPVTFLETDLSRRGDPTLRPRRLTGALGAGLLHVAPGFDLTLGGSYRRVTDDFGWSVTADTVAGVLDVTSVARRRGSGWLSHGAIGWEFRRGLFRSRGVGWVRGGPDSLSPQSGSPPRHALDARAEARIVLFQGDLPLRFGIESHARGPRRGLIREPGRITWDGTLSADFGPAGAYLRVEDLFDARPGSAIWDPAVPSGAPMPGRVFQAGVSWNLLD